MSIHFERGYKYGCYFSGTFGFERHQREVDGDFGFMPELRPRLLDNVGIDVGEVGSVSRVCVIQLPFDKNGKE
jgi:hypothetical protein